MKSEFPSKILKQFRRNSEALDSFIEKSVWGTMLDNLLSNLLNLVTSIISHQADGFRWPQMASLDRKSFQIVVKYCFPFVNSVSEL